jgi:hypothetical protein
VTFGAVLIVWLLCGLIAGAIGASRNVGFLLHALIGFLFLFGPVGIITAVLFKPTDEEVFRSKGKQSRLVKCPYCAELVKAEATICKHCRSDLRGGETPPEAVQLVNSEIYRLLFKFLFLSSISFVSGSIGLRCCFFKNPVHTDLV